MHHEFSLMNSIRYNLKHDTADHDMAGVAASPETEAGMAPGF